MEKELTVAVDIGGSGGKIVTAAIENKKIIFHEQLSFDNPLITEGGYYKVDIYSLFESIKESLKKISKTGKINSFGIDTWGGSYGYVSRDNGSIVGDIYNCRDKRTITSFPESTGIMSEWEIFLATGQIYSRFSVLSQIYTDLIEKRIDSFSNTLLLLPSLISYLFTGNLVCESSMASTTCLTKVNGLEWEREIIKKFGFSESIFPKISNIGSFNGYLSTSLVEEFGWNTKVINTAGHDTAAAIAALPDLNNGDCFISIGTTIVIGTVTDKPVICKEAYEKGFKNSTCAFNKFFLSTDVTGFWIINEIIKNFEFENIKIDFEELNNCAMASGENYSFIDPCAKDFKVKSSNVLSTIAKYCLDHGQILPNDLGSFVRCVLESFAMRIKYSFENLKKIFGDEELGKIYLISGGVRNKLLMQMIADALDKEVYAGLPLATVAGNLIIQMSSTNLIGINEINEICKNSFAFTRYEPKNPGRWRENYSNLINSNFYDHK